MIFVLTKALFSRVLVCTEEMDTCDMRFKFIWISVDVA